MAEYYKKNKVLYIHKPEKLEMIYIESAGSAKAYMLENYPNGSLLIKSN